MNDLWEVPGSSPNGNMKLPIKKAPFGCQYTYI